MSKPHARDWTLLLVLGAIWGSSFMFIKIALIDLPPFTIAAGRIVIAAIVLWAVARLQRLGLPPIRPMLGRLFLVALTGGVVPFFLIAWAELRIDSALAAILMAFVPLSTVVLATVMTEDERLSWLKIAGISLGLAGVVVLVGGIDSDDIVADLVAEAAMLAAALCYAFSNLLARRLPRMPAVQTSTAVLVMSAVLIVPLAAIIDHPWRLDPGAASLASVAMLGVASTGIGVLILFHLLARTGATFVSLNNYLVPMFGTLFGVALMGEGLSAATLMGLALILAGVYLTGHAHRRSSFEVATRSTTKPN